ncbi:MAG: ATP-binding protein, partial [Rhodospirillaceae bacterium]|nr:ATP-binding protein [Rhodospirillaceae bacterium]
MFDRIDLHVDVPAVSAADLSLPPPRESSADVAQRVAAARDIQRARYAGQGIRTNAEADGDLLEAVAAADAGSRALLTEAAEKLRLSARGYHRVLRVARTLADMEHGERGAAQGDAGPVGRLHIAEALSYRRLAPGA